MDSFLPIIFYAITGILAGFLGGLLGIGGGLIAVPSLALIFHYLGFSEDYSMQTAVGTSLGAMVFTTASSAWAHFKHKGILWNLFISMAPGLLIGAFLGALIADNLPSKQLKILFGYFVCLVGAYFLFLDKARRFHGDNSNPIVIFLWSTLIGTISSVLGIGGGIFTVPLLTYFHTPFRNAVSTSAATSFLIALIGALSFLFIGLTKSTLNSHGGYLYMPALISIGLASSLAAPYGAKLVHTLPTKILKKVFGVFLIAIGILMINL